ncbi:MAG: serine/threonine-protein kinase [bacterium]
MTDLCPLCRKQYDDAHARCPDDGTPLIEDRSGQSLGGRYTIRELIGIGSDDVTVWAAWQEDAGRMVAVKLLPLDEAARDRFFDASSLAAKLDHPNVVRLFDFNKTEDGLACAVMELVRGRPLAVELSDDRALPVDEALPLIDQILAGLVHAHENGVLHLDLKPSNIFLVPSADGPPTVKLADFGLTHPRPVAQRFAGPLETEARADEALHYTAPELLASGRAGPQSDLYSVGALLYRLLSGKPPFPFESATEVARGHLTHLPPSPYAIRPIGEMPAALPEILEQALDKAPARRFASAEDMHEAVTAAMRGEALIDVRDEATVARVRIDDLSLEPPPAPAAADPDLDDAPEADVSSSTTVIIAVLVLAVGLGLLAWFQLGQRDPATPVAPVAPVATGGAVDASRPIAPPQPTDAARAPAPPPDAPSDAGAPDPQTPDAGPVRVPVRIDSTPRAAIVYLGDGMVGRTPWTARLRAGTYRVRLEKPGYSPAPSELAVTEGSEEISTRPRLVPPPRRRPRPPPPPPTARPRPTPTPTPPRPPRPPTPPTPTPGADPRPAARPHVLGDPEGAAPAPRPENDRAIAPLGN